MTSESLPISDVWTSDHAEPGRNGAQLYSEVREVDARRRRFRHGPMTRGRSKARRKFFECHINYTAMSKRRVQTSEVSLDGEGMRTIGAIVARPVLSSHVEGVAPVGLSSQRDDCSNNQRLRSTI